MLVLGLTLFYGAILFAVWCLMSQCKTRSYMDHLAKLSDAKHRVMIEREGGRRQVTARQARAKRRLSRQLEMD